MCNSWKQITLHHIVSLLQNKSHLKKCVTVKKMGHTWKKCGENFGENFSLGHIEKNVLQLQKWVTLKICFTLGEMGHT